MDFSMVFMWLGFALAAYSVVGNDVIQTLGTFLTSNEKDVKWYYLFAFAATILTIVLIMGFLNNDITYGRLDKFEEMPLYRWYHIIPPIVLLLITRYGIPVSTTFMILTLFSLSDIPNDLSVMVANIFDAKTKLGGMIQKSVMGYVVAFFVALIGYFTFLNFTEQYFLRKKMNGSQEIFWKIAQAASTGFLWSQWLVQDLANIYVYMNNGKNLTALQFFLTLVILNGMMLIIFYQRGGKVQDVVRKKRNTADIRAATFIDLIYGVILYVFKDDYFGLWGGKIPMSTTWVFVGLLAGREIALQVMSHRTLPKKTTKMLYLDLGKIFFGLVISVILVIGIKFLSTSAS
ncbi:MAG: hypothetical protein IPM26_01930 [Saprospiraceae bacterium]|nr:hypothetical protein [Saprospiraceae bacterium]